MKFNPLILFCSMTYLISWSLWFCLMILVNYGLTSYGHTIFATLYLTGGIIPSIAAFMVVGNDKDTHRRLKAEIFRFKSNIFWYIAIFLVPIVISGFSWVINGLFYKHNAPFLKEPIYRILGMLPVMIVGGGCEEIGWRGFLLSKLLQKFSSLKATLIVSLIWGIWHLPLWALQGVPQYDTNFPEFILGTISMSFLLTVLYLATRSVFLCILFHAVVNAYLNIGMDSWINGTISGWMNSLSGLVLSAFLFWLYRHFTKP